MNIANAVPTCDGLLVVYVCSFGSLSGRGHKSYADLCMHITESLSETCKITVILTRAYVCVCVKVLCILDQYVVQYLILCPVLLN